MASAASSIFESAQLLIKLLQCSRRKQTPTAASYTGDVRGKSVEGRKGHDYSGFTDASTDYGSDHSGPRVRGGSADSDLDSSDATSHRHQKAHLAPPPGLELPLEQGGYLRARNKMGSLPKQAALQQYVQSRMQATQNSATPFWKQDATSFVPGLATAPPSQESSGLTALRQALDKLAPGDIATVKSMLDSKMQDAGLPGHSNQQSWNCAGTDRIPGGPRHNQAERPFTPFQGGSRTGMNAFSKPAKQPPIEPDGDTLRSFLLDLSKVDNARVLTLRKINRLGLESPKRLQTHLAKFGSIERLMVSHTISKCPSNNSYGETTRLRPAALGFAVMSTVAEAKAAFDHGAVHMVAGVEISVLPFASHSVGSGSYK